MQISPDRINQRKIYLTENYKLKSNKSKNKNIICETNETE